MLVLPNSYDVPFRLSMNFSSDGHFFACTTSTSEVCLWKESPTGYTLSEKFTPYTQCSMPCFSPNCESLVTFSGATIQLWHIKSFTTTASDLAQSIHHTGEDFILEFFPDRPLAAVARTGDRVVTVFDLKSWFPWLTIDTSIEVYGLRLIEKPSPLLVAGKSSLGTYLEGISILVLG